MSNTTEELQALIQIGKIFSDRQWFLGTSGNLSILESNNPFMFSITKSGLDKGVLTKDSFVAVVEGKINHSDIEKPSDEFPIHEAIYKKSNARCIMHIHVVSALLASEFLAEGELVKIENMEILKGLGPYSAKDSVFVPIFDNASPVEIADSITSFDFSKNKFAPAFLIRNHGIFVWGDSAFSTKRHVELLIHAFEYLLAVKRDTLCPRCR